MGWGEGQALGLEPAQASEEQPPARAEPIVLQPARASEEQPLAEVTTEAAVKVVICETCTREVTEDKATPLSKQTFGRPSEPTYRCKACNALRGRVRTALPSLDPEDQTSWVDMGSEAKKKWMSESHDKIGKDLKASMQAEAKKWRETHNTSLFGWQADDWLDEADARTKYKDKPEQLKFLLTHARKVMHPNRGVWVYEDLKVVSSSKEASTEGQRETWSLSNSGSRKATAKPKASPRPAQGQPKASPAVNTTDRRGSLRSTRRSWENSRRPRGNRCPSSRSSSLRPAARM